MVTVTNYIARLVLRRLTLLGAEVLSDGSIALSMSDIYITRNQITIKQQQSIDWHRREKGLEKLKSKPVLLHLTGNGVVSKTHDESDQSIKRIRYNENLICYVDEQAGSVSFLRRDTVQEVMDCIAKHHMLLTDIWVDCQRETNSIYRRLDAMCASGFIRTMLMRSEHRVNLLAGCLFQKLLLPVLLTFLFLLLGNFLLNMHYTSQLNDNRLLVQNIQRANRQQTATDIGNSRLMTAYQAIPNHSVALPADRIASYLPSGVKLSAMSLFPRGKKPSSNGIQSTLNIIRLDGTADLSGKVTLLCQYLEADQLFASVKIISLTHDRNTDLYRFELEIKLENE